MNAEELFEEVGFTHEYRSEFEDFFRPYFDTESDLIDFFCAVFKNYKTDKRPRWMMNDIQRFVALADDIDKIRPGRDPLRILFFRVCLEALQKDSGAKKKGFFEKFETYFSEAGKQYILSNFSFTGIGVPEELEGLDRALFNTHENYQLTVMDFLCIIKATRNAVVHDGDYWSMQFFARDNESTWLTSLTTDFDVISCQPKGKELTYYFQTTLQYDQFEYYFVEACIIFLQDYIDKETHYKMVMQRNRKQRT